MDYSVSETGVSVTLTVKVLEGTLRKDRVMEVILNTRNDSAFGKSITV